MAHGKGRGARDLRYGRRGGRWVDEGHDPTAPKAPITKVVDEKDEDRKARQRAELAAYELANDIVPGTAQHKGDGPGGGPSGGTSWEGRARMAAARRAAGVGLDRDDLKALRRFPDA